MTAIVQILGPDKRVIANWQIQAFGFQAKYNVCINTNMDVLSGFFSGCWMASYLITGQRRIAHVYTSIDTREAKEAFINEVYNREKVISCFKPNLKSPAMQCLGVITSDNNCYSLGVTPKGGPFEFEINYLEKAIPQKSAIV